MELLTEICLTAVCVLGLGFLAWWLMGRLLRPIPERCARVVLSGRGDGAELEQTVRAFVWLRSLGLLNCAIVIADVALDVQGREVALRLSERWPGVALWPAEQFADYITRT